MKKLVSPRYLIEQRFASNGSKISIRIWQEVFNLIEGDSMSLRNNDTGLREAASILIQLAAPRASVFHFIKLAFEKNQNVLHQIISEINCIKASKLNLLPEVTQPRKP